MPSKKPRVTSITVAFNPDPARLAEQIAALRGQVEVIVIVDNGSRPAVESLLAAERVTPPVRFVVLDDNRGVAAGFNVGVREARGLGSEFVLLLDHDSIPTPGMVEQLVEGHRRRGGMPGAAPVAAVGPRVHDVRDEREYPFIRLGWTHNRHVRCPGAGEGAIACDFLISSGSLISVESIAAIGEFDEGLFIDSVDLEWCCRAKDRGYALYGICAARLDHRLGDERREVAKGVKLVVHPPERIYYMTRNRFLLYRRAYMPLKWKLKDFLRSLAKFVATMLLIPPRGEYARMTLQAVRDALGGRGGKLPR